jgi:hypothetical protein
MHILTGILVGALLGRPKSSTKPALLGLGGPIRTVHVLPGRVRFAVERLRGDAAAADALAGRLGRIEGVELVEVSPLSGSVLIRFRAETLEPELLFAAIVRLLGLEKELERAPSPLLTRELREAGQALNRAVYEQTGGLIDLWTAVPLLLAGIGLRKVIVERGSLPAGLTLIWWGYNALLRGGGPPR